MSGGHWNYLWYKLEERAELPSQAIYLLAAIEHALDWGISSDSCYECAKVATIAALEAFFDRISGVNDEASWREAIDSDENRCPACKLG